MQRLEQLALAGLTRIGIAVGPGLAVDARDERLGVNHPILGQAQTGVGWCLTRRS